MGEQRRFEPKVPLKIDDAFETARLACSARKMTRSREGPAVRIPLAPPASPYLPKPRRRYAKSAKHAVSAGLPEKMVLAWPP